MRVVRIKGGIATDVYEVTAEKEEILTNAEIERYMKQHKFIAPFGYRIIYNNGIKAEVKAYVD